jgi:AbiTii
MGSVIQDLQKAILDPRQSLTQLLRQTKMIAGELNLPDVEKWVDLELRGYPDNIEPPAYRVLVTDSLLIHNPYRGWQLAGDVQQRIRARQPIAEIESMSKAKMPQFTPETNFRIRNQLGTTMGSEWPQRVTIDRSQFQNILEAVKEELVQWTTDLRKRGIEGDSMDFNDKEKQAAASQTFNIAGNFHGVVGPVMNSKVTLNDFSSIHQILKDHGISQEGRNEIENIMDALKTASPDRRASVLERWEKWFVKHKDALGASAEIIAKAIGG